MGIGWCGRQYPLWYLMGRRRIDFRIEYALFRRSIGTIDCFGHMCRFRNNLSGDPERRRFISWLRTYIVNGGMYHIGGYRCYRLCRKSSFQKHERGRKESCRKGLCPDKGFTCGITCRCDECLLRTRSGFRYSY